jgi:arginyl-tRNA synthetase
VIEDIRKAGNKYGELDYGRKEKVMLEYSNANTHKEYHVGHLRNICYADAVARSLAKAGYEVIPVSYINDFGIHIAKAIWGLTVGSKANEFKQMIAEGQPKGLVLGTCYAAACKELEDNDKGKTEVSEIMKAIESRAGETYKLWSETRQWSINYFASIYKKLGVEFVHTFYESEVIDEGRKIVDDLLSKGVLKVSEGAVIADLQEYGLGVLPIIRTDGTALYTVGDLALASRKFRGYGVDISIYVVDVRQSLYFKQLFKILELSGYKEKMIHLPYDFVTLKSGMMSSRSGNVITYSQLYSEAFSRAKEETRKRHDNWSDSLLDSVASSLAISAIRFEMAKVSPDKVITFDPEEALHFEGYTAAYLQYTAARISSLINKNDDWRGCLGVTPDYSKLVEDKEKDIILKLSQYSAVILRAAKDYDPSSIARYLFELCQQFNDYYHAFNFGKANKSVRRARVALAKATIEVIKDAFVVLGISYLKEM